MQQEFAEKFIKIQLSENQTFAKSRFRQIPKMLGFALRARDANVPQPNLRIKAFFLKGEGIVNPNWLFEARDDCLKPGIWV